MVNTAWLLPELIEWLKVGGVAVAAAGLCFNAYAFFASNAERRLDYVTDVKWKIQNDEVCKSIYYKIEYGDFSYCPSNFHGSDEEKALDKLLSLFEGVARRYVQGHLNKKDVNFLKYEYCVLFENPNVQKYLQFLNDWTDRRNLPHPFASFIKVGKIIQQ